MPEVEREAEPRGELSPPLHGDAVERVRGLLDRWVARTAEYLVLAMIKKGERVAVVIPAEEYEGYMQTLEIMEDDDAQHALREGEADEREGRIRPYEDARRDLGVA